MHPLKIVQWCLFWKKVAKSWLQHVDGAWTSHCPLSVLLCFLCPLSRPSQSCATWLASIRMSVTLTGSFVRTPLDSKLGLFFFLAWPQTWPSSLRKDLALLLPTLGIPTQRACSWYLAFPFLVTLGNHLLVQVSVPETQWLTWFYTRGILQEFYIRGIQESPTLVSEGDLSCLGSSWLSAGYHEPFSRKMIIYAISISQTLVCIWISRRAC